MNSNQNIENAENFPEEIESVELVENDDFGSVEDFIKQLEAREKDLDISSDLVIEVGESEFDDRVVPEFLKSEIAVPTAKKINLPPPKTVSAPPVKSIELKTDSAALFEIEISALKNKISKMEGERTEIFEHSRRRQKDFETYKSRTERERSETFHNQISNLAQQILPVLDNLDRALNFASRSANGKDQNFEQFYEGIVLVSQQLNEVLAEMGISPIPSVGRTFDPHYHEAVATEETDEFAPNTISAELLRGYRLGERVIRASMVRVAKPVNG